MTAQHSLLPRQYIDLRRIASPTGSDKDRMAVAVLGRALARGDVKPGDRVGQYTGGSTGTAVAFVCAVLRTELGNLTVNAVMIYSSAK
jgi:cysteine synthase A